MKRFARARTLLAGRDFPDFFGDDLFALRRTNQPGAGNPYDPESLLTGAEAAAGLTYDNSRRNWPDDLTYLDAITGLIPVFKIPHIAPRVFLHPTGAVELLPKAA